MCPLYHYLLSKTDLATCVKSGYLQNKLTESFNFPIQPNNNPIEQIIVLTTGSFAPFHQGHLYMLEKTKEYFSQFNLPIQIMISPSHDHYVLTKADNIRSYTIDRRIESILDFYPIENVSLWESKECFLPVNFTEVMLYLQQQQKNVLIAYVFGSDNQDFMNVFFHLPEELKHSFYGVCVERKGYPVDKKDSVNCLYLNNTVFNHISSTRIRLDAQ